MKISPVCCKTFLSWAQDDALPIVFIDSKNDTWGNIFVLWHKFECPSFRQLYFCPWCGKELGQAFVVSLRERLLDLGVERASFDDFNFETEIPEQFEYLKQRLWWDENIYIHQKQHKANEIKRCDLFNYYVEENPLTVYKPNTRAYGLLRKTVFNPKKYDITKKHEENDFEPINYCYFCGAKLPERLDDKLTEILQNECGLESWKDYKKAPTEFHTEKWWKKRGL